MHPSLGSDSQFAHWPGRVAQRSKMDPGWTTANRKSQGAQRTRCFPLSCSLCALGWRSPVLYCTSYVCTHNLQASHVRTAYIVTLWCFLPSFQPSYRSHISSPVQIFTLPVLSFWRVCDERELLVGLSWSDGRTRDRRCSGPVLPRYCRDGKDIGKLRSTRLYSLCGHCPFSSVLPNRRAGLYVPTGRGKAHVSMCLLQYVQEKKGHRKILFVCHSVRSGHTKDQQAITAVAAEE